MRNSVLDVYQIIQLSRIIQMSSPLRNIYKMVDVVF